MAKNLLIVESPAKAKTIENYLGAGYKVVASYGHVRDLPKSKLSIDVEHNFEPSYITPKGSAKRINELKKAVAAADTVYLATDLDREGEAIAWHIEQSMPKGTKQKWHRITFGEITKAAVTDAVAHPRELNINLVDAQQARRILDRLVGYGLSPVLWKKIRYGLSAGRVQSVALKFVMDREAEIEAFKAVKYWTINTELSQKTNQLDAELVKIDGKKAELLDAKTAKATEEDIKNNKIIVAEATTKPRTAHPKPPFTTSTLQQAASSRLGYGTRRTMSVAQKLYEKGHISYMRTDSANISPTSAAAALKTIESQFGKAYAMPKPRFFKTKSSGAQEAHEAIRPSDFSKNADSLASSLPADELKLYSLIWSRAIASQMQPARYNQAKIEYSAGKAANLTLASRGRTTEFAGFTKAYPDSTAEADREVPALEIKSEMKLEKIITEEHETQPPARYSEASLVKKLEAEGIGRPSTYAPTISTIISRGYVLLEEKRLMPQMIGKLVNDLLSENFAFVVDPSFTAKIEGELDEIAEGKTKWQPVVADFYGPMEKLIKKGETDIEKVQIPVIETDEICDVCGKPMVIKSGRFGQFLACSGWPDCKNAKPILKPIGVDCPKCAEGELVERKTKKGRLFYGCSRYPDCDYATWTKPKKEAEVD